MVNYLHEILVKIPTVHSSSVVSVTVPSVHLSDDEHKEIPDKICSTNYGEKISAKITAKIPDDVTLTLCNVKFPEKTHGTLHRGNYLVEFPSG